MKFPQVTRRRLLGLAGAAAVGAVGLRFTLPWWWRARPIRPLSELSARARDLVSEAFDGVDANLIWDVHAHLIGIGSGETDEPWVNPAMQSHLSFSRRLQFDVYLQASGVTDPKQASAQYIERLVALHRAGFDGGALMLLGFDYNVDKSGLEDRDASTFYMPNKRVLDLAEGDQRLEAIVSIHPYRTDAIARLDQAHAAGARAVKWLPNAMGIDPASERCNGFYERLAELGLPLLSHTGHERAVHAPEAQEFGNPLRLKRALDAGVRVIVAHCASMGQAFDLERGDGSASVETFGLFMRMMAMPRYEGLLFGGLSATPFVNRAPEVLRELLEAQSLHERLVYSSDYPLPAIDPLISLRLLGWRGFLTDDERGPLGEIFDANPLLFHFVLVRRLGLESGGRRLRFAPRAFETARLFV